jgi:FkbM family methyltransferase
MLNLPKILKKKTAKILCNTVGHNGSVPILKGPLKHSLLPKTFASENLAMLLGRYEPAVVSELLSAGPIRVAYDVGAHLGFMSLVLSRIVGETGRVFAFEPIPENRVAIDRLIGMNRLDQVIQVTSLALGESNGKKKMLLRECSSMHQLEEAYQGKGSNIYSTVDVESCTLDSFIFERGNLIPQLIKIDVEGAEELVLKGALKTLEVYKPTMVIEIHGPQNALKTWKLLQGTDYTWRHIARGSRQQITCEEELRSYFSPSSWTHHFLMKNLKHVHQR